jgi:DNA-directed RNA polymerase subunit RPC12/RpoP
MTAAWCPESGKAIKDAGSHRVQCERCGKRVLVIGHRMTNHRLPTAARTSTTALGLVTMPDPNGTREEPRPEGDAVRDT